MSTVVIPMVITTLANPGASEPLQKVFFAGGLDGY
jgi:hypothetical protein